MEKYTSLLVLMFEGRLSRSEYIIQLIILTVLSLIFLNAATNDYGFDSSFVWLMIIYISSTIYGFSITIRRLHDFNASGWWSFLGLIPFVNIIFGLVLIFKKGVDGANIYDFRKRKKLNQ